MSLLIVIAVVCYGAAVVALKIKGKRTACGGRCARCAGCSAGKGEDCRK